MKRRDDEMAKEYQDTLETGFSFKSELGRSREIQEIKPSDRITIIKELDPIPETIISREQQEVMDKLGNGLLKKIISSRALDVLKIKQMVSNNEIS